MLARFDVFEEVFNGVAERLMRVYDKRYGLCEGDVSSGYRLTFPRYARCISYLQNRVEYAPLTSYVPNLLQIIDESFVLDGNQPNCYPYQRPSSAHRRVEGVPLTMKAKVSS